jgi:hypothetical protein
MLANCFSGDPIYGCQIHILAKVELITQLMLDYNA